MLCVSISFFSSCSSCNNPKPVTVDTTKPKPVVTVHVPEFDADSSYKYCDEQVKFGPRIPEQNHNNNAQHT